MVLEGGVKVTNRHSRHRLLNAWICDVIKLLDIPETFFEITNFLISLKVLRHLKIIEYDCYDRNLTKEDGKKCRL